MCDNERLSLPQRIHGHPAARRDHATPDVSVERCQDQYVFMVTLRSLRSCDVTMAPGFFDREHASTHNERAKAS